MNKLVIFLLLLLWIAGSSWYYVCQIKEKCGSSATTNLTGISNSETSHSNLPLYYAFSSLDPKKGIHFNQWYDSIVALGSPEKELVITGYFHNSESFDNNISDPGLERARSVQNIFNESGSKNLPFVLESKNLETQALDIHNGRYFDIQWRDKPKTVEMASDLRKMTIYFTKNTTDILSAAEIQAYLDTFATMVKKDNCSVTIEGNTDVSGTPERNLTLSGERAEAVKQMLITRGVPAGNIQAVANGQTKPAASNETEAGREKNRRVELIIK